MTAASRDKKLFDILVELKRHLRSCKRCTAAKRSRVPFDMCNAGLQLTLDAAWGYDDVIRQKIAAHNHPGETVFACPDLTKHGRSYELTAQAFLVTAIQ